MAVELYANGLSAGYTDGFHIRELDLSIPSGKIISLIGANGSGKSTILKALTRLIPKDPTIEHADQILVVDQGRIVQKGTHQKLICQNGLYRRFIEIRERAEGWSIA